MGTDSVGGEGTRSAEDITQWSFVTKLVEMIFWINFDTVLPRLAQILHCLLEVSLLHSDSVTKITEIQNGILNSIIIMMDKEIDDESGMSIMAQKDNYHKYQYHLLNTLVLYLTGEEASTAIASNFRFQRWRRSKHSVVEILCSSIPILAKELFASKAQPSKSPQSVNILQCVIELVALKASSQQTIALLKSIASPSVLTPKDMEARIRYASTTIRGQEHGRLS